MLVEVLVQLTMHIILPVWEVTQETLTKKVVAVMVNGVREAVMVYKVVQSMLQMVYQILEAEEAVLVAQEMLGIQVVQDLVE